MAFAGDEELIQHALGVAKEISRNLDAGHAEPRFLAFSKHINVLLPSLRTVLRLRVQAEGVADHLSRELAVARHLVARGASVVAPSPRYPAGPHIHGRFVSTLWEFVEHLPADIENPSHVASAAHALNRIHGALADYPGALPR